MDITQVHNQTTYSNESSYARSASGRIKSPTDSKVVAYRADKGLWLTQASDGLRFKKGLSNGTLGLGKITRSSRRYLEYIPFTPTTVEETSTIPVETENYSIVLRRFTDQSAPPCEETNYSFDSCRCNPSCYPSVYATAAACTSSATVSAQWITVSDGYEPASDGSCKYQPTGDWLYCDEEILEKFPGYYSVQTPFRYSYQSFSAEGYYRSSASPLFDASWSPAEAAQNGWQRYFPGTMYRKDGTLVIIHRTSASGCDSAPAAPSLPGSITGPSIWGSQNCTLWTTGGGSFTNSFQEQPLSSAPQPDGDPPTRAPGIGEGISGSLNFIHLYGPKARKRFEVRFNQGERVDAFSVATKNNAYMILRSGFVSSSNTDYKRIKIYQNNQLLVETVYPDIPNLGDLEIDDLWIKNFINYRFESQNITPTNPCAAYPIQRKNLVRERIYQARLLSPDNTPILNLNNNDQPEITFDIYDTAGPNCDLTLAKTIVKKIAHFNSNDTLSALTVSFYPSSADA